MTNEEQAEHDRLRLVVVNNLLDMLSGYKMARATYEELEEAEHARRYYFSTARGRAGIHDALTEAREDIQDHPPSTWRYREVRWPGRSVVRDSTGDMWLWVYYWEPIDAEPQT